MPKTSIQFHADPEESVELAARWASNHGLVVVVERFFPEYRAVPGWSNRPSSGRIDRVALCRGDANLSARSAHEFVTCNPECLYFSIGAREGEGLRESALAGATSDPETFRIWKQLINEAKAEMHSGATVRNPTSEASDRAPGHLHTDGAHELVEQGAKMLAAAGWNEFDFDDC